MTDNLNVNIHKVQLLQKSRNTDNAMLVFSGSRSLFNKNENIKNSCRSPLWKKTSGDQASGQGGQIFSSPESKRTTLSLAFSCVNRVTSGWNGEFAFNGFNNNKNYNGRHFSCLLLCQSCDFWLKWKICF